MPHFSSRLIGIAAFVLGLLASSMAQAYIGPGAGVGIVGSLLNTLLIILLALLAILFWPLRLLWRKLKRARLGQNVAVVVSNDAPASLPSQTHSTQDTAGGIQHPVGSASGAANKAE